MNYPVWEMEAGHGALIALVAVIHTFVSQFAIGGGLFLVALEGRARRRGDAEMLGWLEGHSRFFLLLTIVFGALTGVGIWFTIGLINPAGTSALIHAFVWGWAIEWVFFVVEIAAAMVYVYGWRRLSPARHIAVGWIYFAAAWLSLAVINGIVTFMLTPGRWIETRSFWDGVLNPTYLPSLALRTAICIALAGGWALLTGSREAAPALRRRVVRIAGGWTLAGLAIAAASGVWYWHAAVAATRPPGAGATSAIEAALAGAVPAARAAFDLLPVFVAAAALLAIVAIAAPRAGRAPVAAAALLSLLLALGAFEWLREGVRKPWLVRGYLYANGALASEPAAPLAGGLAAHAVFLRPKAEAGSPRAHGEDLFRIACRSCHTVDGYLGIRRLLRGRSEAALAETVGFLHKTRAAMPPFRGSPPERAALAAFLAGLSPAPAAEIVSAGDAPGDAGGRVFARDCASCHAGPGAVAFAFRGLVASDAETWLDEIGESFEGRMPRFFGTPGERAALAALLVRAADPEVTR